MDHLLAILQVSDPVPVIQCITHIHGSKQQGNIPDTVVILRDQAEEFPLQLYMCLSQPERERERERERSIKVLEA